MPHCLILNAPPTPCPAALSRSTATTGALTAHASITVTGQTFTSWQSAHFTDADADGFANPLEHARGAVAGFAPHPA